MEAFKKSDLKQHDPIAARQMLEISQFTSNIFHIAGDKNVAADFLSRLQPTKQSQSNSSPSEDDAFDAFQPLIRPDDELVESETKTKTNLETSKKTAKIQTSIGIGQIDIAEMLSETVEIEPVNMKELAESQKACPETQAVLQSLHAKHNKFSTINHSGFEIVCELSASKPRPLVPKNLRSEYIKTLHSIGHPSINETYHRVSSNFYWNKTKKDVTDYVKSCHQCLSVKPSNQPKPHYRDMHPQDMMLPLTK